jgi:sarcosine oxidase subunit alpha
MTQPNRLAQGGRIDRSRPLGFSFDGRHYTGYAGDTLASALIANGVSIVGRSFKYSRPRGIVAAGAEEPNAIVQLGATEATQVPNVRATEQALYEGLVAHPTSGWPSVESDAMGFVVRLVSRLLPRAFTTKLLCIRHPSGSCTNR